MPLGGHITPTVKQLIAQNKLQSDAQNNNLIQGTPMPIQNDLNSQSSCVVPSPSKSDLSCFINSVQPTPQKQKSTQDSAADGPQSSQLQQQDSKINKMFKKYEKAINEKWKKALKYLGINENLFPSRKDEIETYYPFSQYNLENVRKGVFMQQQLERIVLEITNIDNNAQCYHAKFKDLKGEEIFGTFHNDCKDNIRNLKMRKGSIVILKEVSCFSIVHDKYYQTQNEYRNQSIKI